MAYTQEGIMAQIMVAFGQGTGEIRVSQDAAMQLRTIYFAAITAEVVASLWATEAVQVLERIRAIGRLAAQTATAAGATAISVDDVMSSAAAVQATSDTVLCPPLPT
jgi:hypothetical protein